MLLSKLSRCFEECDKWCQAALKAFVVRCPARRAWMKDFIMMLHQLSHDLLVLVLGASQIAATFHTLVSMSIGLASDQAIIERIIFTGTKHGKGFCKDSCGCLLNFPTFPKDQHGSTVDVSIECLFDNVSSPCSQSTCLEFHIAKVRVPQLLLKLPWSCWLGF